MHKKTLLIITFLCLAFNMPAQEVILVKSGEGDATPRLQSAIEQARQHNGKKVEIRLEQGDYHIHRTSASTHIYYISNTASERENPDPTKHIGLWLRDLKNVTINGGGARFITHGEMTTFVVDQCENIMLCNFSLKAADPSMAEMTVVDVAARTATFRVHPDNNYEIKDNDILWKGEGWSFTGGVAPQTFNPQTNITHRRSLPTDGKVCVEEVGKHLIRIEYADRPNVYPGEILQIRDAIRDEVCGFIHRSKNVTLQNLNLHFLGNFGIVGQYSENLTYDRLNCEPEYGSGRTCAGFADFVQMSGCKGKISIMNSRFEGAHDDPINIHGTHLKVMAYEADNVVRVRFMHDQSYGFDAFFPGDKIEITDVHALKCLFAATVKKVERLNDYEIKLTLSHPVPGAVQEKEAAVENITWTPEVEIRNNYFSRMPTRGILVTTRQKVCIEDNVFYRTPMSAIAICNDARGWYESGPVHDVLIRHNNFIECGSPVISIAPENHRPDGYVHRGIRIESNRFTLNSAPAVEARWTDGISITDNYFETTRTIPDDSFIRLENCINQCIEGNRNK
ncbi:right-handed parallel beta-helix repeat-containing protein [Bacteroides sp. 51]|uniref:right-handed parallel beta-helix repeat-containing protein n=1 Tax=Bacteroides sp. 51 TaxID=2302938 RepID=UPI0013D36C87|nr:right-handed parallel beta-helix repeat-containing protein [Bacteroides sp. 51]NDV80991.1 right-handed parallel beta-helix repeat-containing protein [Bacteroides sp. 51]